MSVRARLTLLTLALTATAMVAMSLGVYITQRRALVSSLEEALVLEAEWLLATDIVGPIEGSIDDDYVAQVLREGVVVAATPALTEPIKGVGSRIIRPTTEPVDYLVVTRSRGSTTAHAGAPLDDVADGLRGLTAGLAWFGSLALAILGGAGWWLTGRGLAPVVAIGAEAARVGPEGLDRRVPVPNTGDEVADLARTVNRMLDRLQEGVDREQRFVGDASHELRTPLTRIRTLLEVYFSHPSDADSTLRAVHDEVLAMQTLIDDLLLLARSDVQTHIATVDLDDIVGDEVAALGAVIDLRRVSGAQVRGDRRQLTRAIRNLLTNAVQHGEPPYAVSVREVDGWAEVAVSDSGPGIPASLHERVFERFAVADASRAGPGSGLGLAIAREAALRHGGTLIIDPGATSGTRFLLRIPMSDDP